MGRQIIKQPDGLYCVWSTIVDDFVWSDCTKEELIKEMVEEEMEEFKERLNRQIEEVDTGMKKSQFSMTYEECLKYIRQRENGEEG